LTQHISYDNLQFKILALALADVPSHFKIRRVDPRVHEKSVFEIQLVRGLALRECAPPDTHLLPDGRHFQQIDAESWHVLLQNSDGRTLGCARYRPLNGHADQLGANHSAIARSNRYGPVLKSAMQGLILKAQERGKHYGEAGGWALRQEIRGSTAAVNVALMTFALAENLGSGLAITTATRMHQSSSILCRIGASRVPELPAYYEPKFGSILEVLHFDLPNTNARYAARLDKFRSQVLRTPVICAGEGSRECLPPPYPMAVPGIGEFAYQHATN
jgi:hypothetical protein